MQKLVKLSLFVMNAAPFPHVSNPTAPHCHHTYQGMKFTSHFTEISRDHLEIYDHLESDCQDDWPQRLIGFRSRMVDLNN